LLVSEGIQVVDSVPEMAEKFVVTSRYLMALTPTGFNIIDFIIENNYHSNN
jgi:hypothetical protein